MVKVLNRKSIALLAAALLAACMVLFAGCSSPLTIGEQSNDASRITAKNATGQAITAVNVKSTLDTTYTELKQSGDWKNDAEATLYILPPAATLTETETTVEFPNATATEDADAILQPFTEIQITMADGMNYVIHQLTVADMSNATFKIDDGTAYVVYKSAATGSEVNTLEAERAYQEQVKQQAAAAQKAAEEQAAAEKAAAEQAAAEQAAAEQAAANKASQSSSSTKSSSSSSSSSKKSNKEDQCVDDLVLN